MKWLQLLLEYASWSYLERRGYISHRSGGRASYDDALTRVSLAGGSREIRSELKMDGMHAAGTEGKLDAIRAGGRHLVTITQQRMAEAMDALIEGDFQLTCERLNLALSFVGPLAQAQQYIAVADGSKLMLAADLEEGMVLADVGEVSDVTVESCPSPQCRRHIKLKVGGHDLSFHGDAEVYVVA